MSETKSNNVDDGIECEFEYYHEGIYKKIFRNNPQTGSGFDAEFVKISDAFEKIYVQFK